LPKILGLKGIVPVFLFFLSFFGGFLLFFSEEKTFLKPEKILMHTPEQALTNKNPQFPLESLSKLVKIAGKPDTASFIIPLNRIGRLYMMEATIDGEAGNLIFDSGATTLVLNRTYFRDHLNVGEQTSAGITGSVTQADKVTVDNLAVGNMKFKKLSANLTDLGHIENRRGVKVLGLFGFELIKTHQITIDLVNNKLILHPIDRKGNLLDTTKLCNADFTQNIEVAHNILFVKGKIGGKLLRFCFDTGAETNALSTDLDKNILKTISITRTLKLRGAGSSSNEVIYGVMNNFTYGDSALNNMQTIITYMDHLNEAYGVHIDGVLGFDFLSKGTFCINFAKRQMGISFITQGRQ